MTNGSGGASSSSSMPAPQLQPLPFPEDDEEEDGGGDHHAPSTVRSRTKSVSVEIYSVKDPPKKRSKTTAASSKAKSNPEKSEVQRARMATLPSAPLDIPTSILDSRQVADTDESYSENERALSNFLKLHPMLRHARLPQPRTPHPPPATFTTPVSACRCSQLGCDQRESPIDGRQPALRV